MSSPPVAPLPAPGGIVVAVMGSTGTGKSTFINLISKSSLKVSTSLRSCTDFVQPSDQFFVDGIPVTLLDTPGFDDTTLSDSEILKRIASYLAASYESGLKLSGIIYLHRISDYRMGGISRKNFTMFRKLCGDDTLKNVVIVTNMWGNVALDIGEKREEQLRTDEVLFKPVLDKGAIMLRHHNTEQSAQDILRHLIRNHPEVLQIQREIVDDKKDITETQACEMLDKDLEQLREQHIREMQQLREQMEEALRDKDEQTRTEIEATRREMDEKLTKAERARSELSAEFNAERKRFGREVEEIKCRLDEERENAAERQRQYEIAEEKHQQDIRRLQEELERKQSESESKIRGFMEAGVREQEAARRQLAADRRRVIGNEYELQARTEQDHAEQMGRLRDSLPSRRTPRELSHSPFGGPKDTGRANSTMRRAPTPLSYLQIEEIQRQMALDKKNAEAQIEMLENERRRQRELNAAQRNRDTALLREQAASLQTQLRQCELDAQATQQAIDDHGAKRRRGIRSRIKGIFKPPFPPL